MIFTTCGNSEKVAKVLARKLNAVFSPMQISSFPDGEIYLRFNAEMKGKKLIIVQSFQPDANKSLFQILVAAETAHNLGAKKVILAAPYLGFMRQDKQFNSGEAITSKIMGKHLSMCLDKIITIDPHLHRYKSLADVFSIPHKILTANLLIAEYIQKKIKNAVIVGPDWESYQWAEEVAMKIGAEASCLEKTRFSSRKVRVKMVKPVPLLGRNCVLVDDIISTGNTMAEAAKKVKSLGAKTITAIGIHGLFVDGTKKLYNAGINTIVTTNCIEHETNEIDVTSLLLEELKKEK